jgi:hypothetical protein
VRPDSVRELTEREDVAVGIPNTDLPRASTASRQEWSHPRLRCQARSVDNEIAAALISAAATLGAALLAATLTWYATERQHREARRAEQVAQRRGAIEAFRRRLAGAMEAVRVLIEVREHGGESDEFDNARWLLGELGPEATLVGIHLPDGAKEEATTAVDELRQALNSIRSENVNAAQEAYQRAEAAAARLNETLQRAES